ncbi:AI-2E family transporter [Luteolibacter sp. AS25]|uniref:AI-2E family transporter n=1 Tax=Luteolibacter sp. AS25 TaxID=3135776 RepID=UPI00398AC457
MKESVEENRRGMERILRRAAVALLVVLGVYVLKPFAPAVLWSMILGFVLFPIQRRFTKWLGGRQTVAAFCVTVLAVLIVVVPVGLIGLSLVDDAKRLANNTREGVINAPEEAPQWLRDTPVIGSDIGEYWRGFINNREEWVQANGKDEEGAEETAEPDSASGNNTEAKEDESTAKSTKKLENLADKTVAPLRNLVVWIGKVTGRGLSQIVISLFLVFFILKDAPKLAERLKVAVGKIAGEQGGRLLDVAQKTVKGVVYGYLGTSAAQAVVAGIGFLIAGVPGAVLLAALTFFLAVVPVGPPVIWGGAAAWLFMQDRVGWGIFMLIWGMLGISSIDNVLRPFLLSQENKMPFALMFIGLVGGAVAFGLVGIFLGPAILAVAFRLLDEWTEKEAKVS